MAGENSSSSLSSSAPITVDLSTFVPTTPISKPSSTSSSSSPAPATMPSQDDISRIARVYGLDPDVINKQIMQESSGNPHAISNKGAIGLMQLMPGTAARLSIDPTDPTQNLIGGMREMSRLLTKYNGDYSKALAAYNSGDAAVDHANGIPDIKETRDYVNNILKGTSYEHQLTSGQPISTPNGLKVDMSTFKPTVKPPLSSSSPSQPSAATRFASAATETSSGLPADITKWPEAIANLTSGPIPSSIAGQSLPFAGPLNIAINTVKGTIDASRAASQRGIDQFNRPGADNKVAGALKYVIGGVPILGPSIVRSMEAAENGDYAGMLGTLTGLGIQAISSNPETAAAHLDAAGKYLFSKPRVQETILSGETKEMLTQAEAAARAKGHSLFPSYSDIQPVPGHQVDEIAQKALNDHITGITSTPRPIADILGENPAKFTRIGAMETPGGSLVDIFTRMSSDKPVSMADLHNYYTKLGEYGAKDLPGDVYAAVKQTRNDIGKLIEGQYKQAGPDPTTGIDRVSQWQDARSYWHDLATHWFDSDSPLRQSLNANDPSAILRPLTGDQSERAASYLRNYVNEGADPNSIKAIGKFYQGLNQMQLRGLLQASGGLLLSYMMRSEGAPAQMAAAAAGSLLGRRLVTGYFRTRPSLTSLLAEAAEKPSLGRQLPSLTLPSGGGSTGPIPSPVPKGSPSPSGPIPSPSSPSSVEPDITPSESTFLSSIADSVGHPDLSADIKAATGTETKLPSHDDLVDKMIEKGVDNRFAEERARQLLGAAKGEPGYNQTERDNAPHFIEMYMGPERRNLATRPKIKPETVQVGSRNPKG